MNQLQKFELQTLDIKNQKFKISSLHEANWAFKKIDSLNAKQKEIKQLAINEIKRIEDWQYKELEQINNSREYFEYILKEYYREKKSEDSKFRLSTPYGKITARKGAKIIQFSNEQKVIKELEKRGFNAYIKITKK